MFNSDDDLTLKKNAKTLKLNNSCFYDGNKYYLQVFLDECLCKL